MRLDGSCVPGTTQQLQQLLVGQKIKARKFKSLYLPRGQSINMDCVAILEGNGKQNFSKSQTVETQTSWNVWMLQWVYLIVSRS